MKAPTPHKPANRMRALEQRMRAEPPLFCAPDGFTERVMENLGRREPQPAPHHAWPGLRLWIGFATVACALLLVLKLLPGRPVPPEPQQLAEVISRLHFPEISLAKVEALTAKLDEPLEAELKNVISDTRQAIHFVASNFLPEN